MPGQANYVKDAVCLFTFDFFLKPFSFGLIFIMENQNKKQEIDDLWFTIQDLIGPAASWPKWIRDLFFTRNLNHAQRPLICAFVIFNGLDPVVSFQTLYSYLKPIFNYFLATIY